MQYKAVQQIYIIRSVAIKEMVLDTVRIFPSIDIRIKIASSFSYRASADYYSQMAHWKLVKRSKWRTTRYMLLFHNVHSLCWIQRILSFWWKGRVSSGWISVRYSFWFVKREQISGTRGIEGNALKRYCDGNSTSSCDKWTLIAIIFLFSFLFPLQVTLLRPWWMQWLVTSSNWHG